MRTKLTALGAVLALTVLALLSLSPVVGADEAEPPVIAQAWYWVDQQNVEQTTPVGNVSVEAPSPFCPTIPGVSNTQVSATTCAQGRLPVEVVNGDYERPNKLSALAFDFTSIPVGSTVSEFTVTFYEAESGCREKADTETGQQCEQTDAQNIEDKEVQACLVDEIFGDGDARPYKEIPKYTCSDSDPKAVVKEIENNAEEDPEDADPDHIWTFDLTPFAEQWVQTFSVATGIMLHPVEPEGDAQGADDVDWRVVFTGPKFQEGKRAGIETQLVFEPPKTPTGGTGTGTGTTGTTGTTDFGTGTTGTTGTTDFGTGTTGTGTTDLGTTPTTDTPIESPETETTAAEQTPVETIPWYVWAAVAAGLIAFALVRSAVIEKTVGHRPDGVVAQIHRLNAERRVAAAEAVETPAAVAAVQGAFSAIGRGLSGVGKQISTVIGKLRRS